MKELKFYIDNLDPQLLAAIKGRPRELIELLKEENFIDEKIIAKRLFSGKWAVQKYINLKNRTKKIVRAFFLIGSAKKSNEIIWKLQECRKNYFLSMSLIESSQRPLSKSLLIKALNIALPFNFTWLAYSCAKELMITMALEKRKKQSENYRLKMIQLRSDLTAEDIAEQYYHEIALYTKRNRENYENQLSVFIQELKEISCVTPKFLHYYYTLRIFRNTEAADYHNTIKDTEYILQVFQSKKGVYNSWRQFFTRNKAIAHTALGEYPTARKLFLQAEQYAPPNSYNLGILKYYQAINALHSADYQWAYRLYRHHRKSKFEVLAEQWAIMGAYLYFLKNAGKISVGNDRFSLGKYLNETASATQDKMGSNLNIIIGELLLLLVKDRGKLIDRIESVNQYSYKYLKDKDTRRAKWFLRILCMLPKANFHPQALLRLTQKQMDNLEKYPMYLTDSLSVELVPFGALLEVMMKELERKVA